MATALNGAEGITQAKGLHPDVVLMDLNMPILNGIEATSVLVEEVPGCAVIIMSVQGEREYLRQAVKSGASEFLIKPFSARSWSRASIAFTGLNREGHRCWPLRPCHRSPPRPPARPPTRRLLRARIRAGSTFSTPGKAGWGKSLIAANLAVAMARQTRARVALVDLDLQFGDIAMLLNLDASHGITHLIENINHLDRDFIEQIMVDGPFGLKALLAPIKPEHADLVMVDHVRAHP